MADVAADPATAAPPVLNARKLPKSRDGCQQCKIRKLKCDESKPECKNCVRRGNVCPGYKKVLKWNTKHEKFKSQESVFSIQGVDEELSARAGLASQISTAQQPSDEQHGTVADEFPSERPSKRRRSGVSLEAPGAIVPVATVRTLPGNAREDLDVTEASDDAEPVPVTGSSLLQVAQASPAKTFLRAFYRLPNASPRTPMTDTGSYLIQHYFQDVCTIFSSFDSTLNPFRMSVARVWGDSEPIYYAIQSMAAGHLANTYPQMGMVGIEMQKKASESLKKDLNLALTGAAKPDRSLLTLLLLGLSACWHKPNDLGLRYLRAARSLMCNKLLQDKPPESKEQQRQDQFFEEALVYWEMMMGFVSPDAGKPQDDAYTARLSTPQHFPLPQQDPLGAASRVLPHPWTGVAPRAQILLAEVGRLVREERLEQRAGFFELDPAASRRRFALAQSLEEELLAIEPPAAEAVVDVRDENTTKGDFLVIAQATSCAALLDLYRIFPGLLAKRLGPDVPPDAPLDLTRDLLQPSVELDADAPAPSSILFDDFIFPFPLAPDAALAATAAVPSTSPSNPNVAFLNSLATHILTLIEALPASSGTRFLQLMLLVIAGSELRFAGAGGAAMSAVNLDFFDPPAGDDARVAHARDFVEGRLAEHGLRLPAKPVRRMVEIVREVWRRCDEGQGDVFWLDIVIERGWETVMG